MAHQNQHLASDPPHAAGSLAAFAPRDASLRALAPQVNLGAQLLTYTSTLRGLLATDPPSHSVSKPIRHFWSWLGTRLTGWPNALRELLASETTSHDDSKPICCFYLSLEACCGLRIAQNQLFMPTSAPRRQGL
jgi:hypothetical protein